MPADADGTRQRLLEAAGAIFAKKGLHAANIREIVARAGANIAAVNYHFGSKDDLYVAAVKEAYEAIARAVPWPPWLKEVPAEKRLYAFVHTFLSRVLRQPGATCPMHLLMRELEEPTPACLEFVKGHVRPTFEILQDILDDLLPADVPGQQRHLIGGSIIAQCLHYHHARAILPLLLGEEEYASYTVERLAEQITRFSLAAIRNLYPAPAKGGRK
jgi:TetR/AcrR family transcriptional regulator, regulator of cefoperazone and chloramphenicol sensitivity